MKFALKDVLPNPFRNLSAYPIVPGKVERLVESINATTFWENIVARKRADGKLEIAYGHHRLKALNEVYPKTQEFNWIIRDITDAMMVKIMVQENAEEYGSNFSVLLEGIRATVQAYADGKISPEEMPLDPRTRTDYIRSAPSFCICANVGAHSYTIDSIGEFLGMTKKDGRAKQEVADAIRALALMERGVVQGLNDALLLSIPTAKRSAQLTLWEDTEEKRRRAALDAANRAKDLREQQLRRDKAQKEQEAKDKAKREELAKRAAEARRADNEALAKRIAKEQEEQKEKQAARNALDKKRRALIDEKIEKEESRAQEVRAQKIDPNVAEATALIGQLDRELSQSHSLFTRITALSRVKLPPQSKKQLAVALRELAQRAKELSGKFSDD